MPNGETSTNAAEAGDTKNDEQSRRPPYTMHGVLHFIQHEWSRYEMERAKWELERAEMQARISFLQGERNGQENLKADLVRRIKMLEYCLKQERAKNYRLTHNGEDPPEFEEEAPTENDAEAPAPMEIDAVQGTGVSALSWRQGRQLLKKYLEEIGYSETVLDVRDFRVKNLLGLIPQGDWPSNDRNAGREGAGKGERRAKKKGRSDGSDEDDSDSDEGIKYTKDRRLDDETEEALDEFSFLEGAGGQHSNEATDSGAPHPNRPRTAGVQKTTAVNDKGRKDDWNLSPKKLDQMKEQYKSEKRTKRSMNSQDDPNFDHGSPKDAAKNTNSLVGDAIDIPADGRIDIGAIQENFGFTETEDGEVALRWGLRWTLRSHLDSVRAMQFHPVEPVLVTASEDGTAKLWNLNAKTETPKGSSPSTTSSDLEPVYTFRGHDGAVLAISMSSTGDGLFTGGLDGVIASWRVPSINIDIHEAYDPRVLNEKLRGHTDAIWDLAYHESANRLVSASADCTVKIWEPGVFGDSCLRTIAAPAAGIVPTSVDFVSTEPQQLLTAYTRSQAYIVDVETGKSVLSFDFGEDAASLASSRVTKILSHPTMPVTIVAGEDRKIRFFDNNTGKQIECLLAHVEGVSCLAVDPNGLYMLSGSHDGSLRLWNMEKKMCLQEIAAHRKKYDAAVACVAFHPSRPLIGSGGADSLAKVFASQHTPTSADSL